MFDIQGTPNSERLDGTAAGESIYTGDGTDTVSAGAGNDSVNGAMVNGQISYYAVSGAKLMAGGEGDDLLYGGSGADTVAGDAGNDTLYGAAGDDSLSGGDGADDMDTGDGQDEVLGGEGRDSINGRLINALTGEYSFFSYAGSKRVNAGGGDDFVYGGVDNDSLVGGDGQDSLHGNAGNDTLQGDAGDDALWGEEGDDSLVGGEGADVIETGDGQDTVSGGSGNDNINGHSVDVQEGTYSFTSYAGVKLVDAGAGDDFVYGGTGNDSLVGGDGQDMLHGSDGHDTLHGDGGNDALFGEAGNDSLVGGDGADAIETGEGQDTVTAGDGNDNINGHLEGVAGAYSFQTYSGSKLISAGAGDDFLYGGTDNDTLLGESGNDILHGNSGNDSLDGGRGNDELSGESGNDTLAAFNGRDTLNGGLGDDRYLIGTTHFSLVDEAGVDSAEVSVDFVKMPSFIEQVTYTAGTQALPYWISALLPDEAAGLGYLSALNASKTYAYAFPETAPSYLEAGSDYLTGWRAFTAAQASAVKQSLSYISGLVNLKFVQSTVTNAVHTLTFANNTQTNSAGYALHPSDVFLGSDVFLSDTDDNRVASDGTYAALTLIHEVGHALGLKHPFSENDSTGDSAPPPYLAGSEDSTAWTVMSYNSDPEQYAFKYSDLDIAALQYLYGPSLSSRTGNDSYTVTATAPQFVWDGAGTDVLDASALSQPVTLYLTPGYWGFVGSAAAATITSAGQVTVNFGSTIENLKGGSQADRLYGNASANAMEGGAGDDVLQGWDGSDTLMGGAGNDTIYGGNSTERSSFALGTDVAAFSGPFADYRFSWSATPGALTVYSLSEGTDTLWDVERLQFSDVTVPLQNVNGRPVAPKLVPTAGVKSSVDPRITFTTSLGSFELELNSDSAPVTTSNFLAYVNSGYYNSTLFHRVIANFMAQGGGITSGMVALSSEYASIVNEASNGLLNLRGTVAMARGTSLNSATSQFFVNYKYNYSLDGKYAVFGNVVSGMAIVDQMASIPTQNVSSYEDVPSVDILTIKAEQTRLGQWVTTTGILALSDLQSNTTWEYSTNGGVNWIKSTGNYLQLPEGLYEAGALQVRQITASGLSSHSYTFPGDLRVDRPQGFQLTGTAVFWKDLATGLNALSDVKVSADLPGKTDALGVVDLSGVESLSSAASGSVVLAPSLDRPSNAKSAITLTDVLAALKIYLGKSVPDAYASPLNFLAADFDASGSVTLTDVLQLLKYYLGKSTTNNIQPEWAFVDAMDLSGTGSSATLQGANGQPLSKTNALPQAIDLDLTSTVETVQIIGVLRGDVDGTWSAPSA